MTLRPALRPVLSACHPGAFELIAAMTAGSLVTAPAHASTAVCPIVIDDTQVAGWQTAVSHAAQRLAELARKSQVDCRSVEVHPNAEPPEVVFVTSDGRRAVRSIAGPEELADTVDALAVTFTVEQPAADGEEATAAPDKGVPAAAATAPAAMPIAASPPAPPNVNAATPHTPMSEVHAAAPPATPVTALALSGEVGFRSGQGTGSPVIAGQSMLELEHFELGVAAQWESGYVGFGEEQEGGKSASGVAARLLLGARLYRARPVRLSAGLSLGAAALELKRGDSLATAQPDDSLEARFGAYATARAPGTGRVGMLASVVGEWTPAGLRTNDASPLPSVALLGVLGFEVEVP